MKANAKTVLCALALLVPCQVMAQEESPEEAQAESKEMARAREAAHAFLSKGRYAPWPNLDKARFAQAHGWLEGADLVRPSHRGRCFVFRYATRTTSAKVRVSPTNEVVFYMSSGRGLEIPNYEGKRRMSDDERKQELETVRAFSDRELLARARRFLQQVYPRFAQRRFDVRMERTRINTDAERIIGFEEMPGRGVAATYPNRITVFMNPGTGEVTLYTSTIVHEALKKAPPVSKAQAHEAAQKYSKMPKVLFSELKMILKKNVPEPVWIVATESPDGDRTSVLVSATTGKELSFQETLE